VKAANEFDPAKVRFWTMKFSLRLAFPKVLAWRAFGRPDALRSRIRWRLLRGSLTSLGSA